MFFYARPVAGDNRFQYGPVFEVRCYLIYRHNVAVQFFGQNRSIRNNIEVLNLRLQKSRIVTKSFKRLRRNSVTGLPGSTRDKR